VDFGVRNTLRGFLAIRHLVRGSDLANCDPSFSLRSLTTKLSFDSSFDTSQGG